MSGGSYSHAYRIVEQFAEALDDGLTMPDYSDPSPTGYENNHDRLGFAVHLRKVAAAMKAIEWVDSGDASPPHDTEAISAATGT